MADGRHLKIVFWHKKAPISVNFCVRKQFFKEFR